MVDVSPLRFNSQIVDKNGQPTSFFLQQWQSLLEFQSQTGVQSLLDAISTTQGTVLYRNASAWTALGPGTSGQVLQTNGASANPSWETPAAPAAAEWEIASTWTHSADVSGVNFAGLEDYDEIWVVCTDLTTSISTSRDIFFSDDGGSTFYSSSGDYRGVNTSGLPLNFDSAATTGNSSSGRSMMAHLSANKVSSLHRPIDSHDSTHKRYFEASSSVVDAVRVAASSGNLTGGAITIFGR